MLGYVVWFVIISSMWTFNVVCDLLGVKVKTHVTDVRRFGLLLGSLNGAVKSRRGAVSSVIG